MSKKHILYFDALRVFAIFAVILLHVAANGYGKYDVGSMTWNVALFWNSLSRWGVPVFVMISGALFLQPSKELSIKTIFSKYIKRIFILIVSWSVIYSLYRLITGDMEPNVIKFITGCVGGYYHLWFLYMIIGLYAITPFLKRIVENETYMKYFIVLSLIFSFTIPTLYLIGDSFTVVTGNDKVANDLNLLFDRFQFSFTLKYVSYYVIGYYLTTIDISRKSRFVIYLLGLLSFAFSFCYSFLISIKSGTPWDIFSNLTLNVFFESLAVFLLIKTLFSKQNRLTHIMNTLSKYSLGIYLIHAMVLKALADQEWFDGLYQSNFISMPLFAISIFAISLFCIIILGKVSIFKKIIS